MSIHEIQSSVRGYANEKTLKNYQSVLNKVNKHYGWDIDIVYFDRMDNNAKEIAKFLYKGYKITNTAQFAQKMAALSSLMKATGFQESNNLTIMVKHAGKFLSVEDTSLPSEIPDWEVLQPKLVELGKIDNICGIIARIFSYGYVLRSSEIFETRVDEDNDFDNYLDLNGCKWYIRKQKNGTEKIFDVDPELCQSLKANCDRRLPTSPMWLLCKANGDKYGTGGQRLPYHKWPLPNNNDIRKSYETWNRHRSGRSDSEKMKWHTILGHSKDTVKVYYDMNNFTEPEKSKPKPKIRLKVRPSVAPAPAVP